jgi:hypothetical protein
MRTLDVAGCRACACRENGQLRVHGAARLGRLRKPVDDVLDRVRAISHLSFWPEEGGALPLLQGDFHVGNLVTIVTICSGSLPRDRHLSRHPAQLSIVDTSRRAWSTCRRSEREYMTQIRVRSVG